MERKAVAVCLVISFLSLLSAGLGFAAEFTKIKASGIIRIKEDKCMYPSTPASLLGMLSSLFFMAAHLSIYAAAGCICCQRRREHSNLSWAIASISFIVSWMSSVPAIMLLLHGALLNDQGWDKAGETVNLLVSFCNVADDGVFSSGAALVLTSNSLGVVYYLLVRRRNKGVVPVSESEMPEGEFFDVADIAMMPNPNPPLPEAASAPPSPVVLADA